MYLSDTEVMETEHVMAEDTGFSSQDRETLIIVKVELGHIRELMTGIVDRLLVLEKDHVRNEQIRALEIDVDALRDQKLSRDDLRLMDLKVIKNKVDSLDRYRWFERGVVAAAIVLGEVVLHVLFK